MAALLGSWTGVSTTNSTTLQVTVGADIPAGSRLVLATNKSTNTTNGVASISGATWTKTAHSCRASTHDMSVHTATASGVIPAGTVITIAFPISNSRKTAVLTAWSGMGAVLATSGNAAYGPDSVSVGPNGSSATESASTTDPGDDTVICVFSRAGTTTATPATPGGITAINTAVTAAGSSDRGLMVAYYTAPSSAIQTATATLSASGSWAAAVVSLADAAPPSGPQFSRWDGVVETGLTVSLWDGASEVPLTPSVT